jgi:hypothetical protein
MSRLISAITTAVLLALAIGLAPSAYAQSPMNATSGDAYFYRGTGGVPPQ